VGEAVIAEMIAEGAFRKFAAWSDPAGDAEVRLREDGQPAGLVDHVHPAATEHSRKKELRHPFGKRHDRGDRHGGRTATKIFTLSDSPGPGLRRGGARCPGGSGNGDRLPGPARRISGELDPVHADIGVGKARMGQTFGVDLGQRDVASAVEWPGFELRQLRNPRFPCQDGAILDPPWQGMEKGCRDTEMAPGTFQGLKGVQLEPEEALKGAKGLSEDESGPLHGPEYVSDHGERGTFNAGEQNGRAFCLEDPPLDCRDLLVSVDLHVNALKLPCCFQVTQALGKISVAHG